MAIVPDFPIVTIQEEVQIPNRTYKLDLEKGRIVGYVDDEEAIAQAAMKVLRTPRMGCYAYDDQYGSEVATLLGNPNLTREYIEAEMEFILQDSLRADGRFLGIEDLQMTFSGDAAFFTFIASTTQGEIELEGVSNDV